jgi:hypothetical protein
VVLSIARSNRYANIEPWRVTATGFRHRDIPLGPQKSPPLPVSDLRGTPRPHTDEVSPPPSEPQSRRPA